MCRSSCPYSWVGSVPSVQGPADSANPRLVVQFGLPPIASTLARRRVRGLHFDGALWPGYEAVAARDSAAACFEILRFYRGLPMARLPALVAEFWRSPAGERTWRLDVLATLRYVAARGAAVFVVSATPTPVFGDLAATLGIAGIVGLELEVDADNRATGRHTGIPTLGEGKVTRLRASTVAPCLLAAGNSALDVPLLVASRGLAWAVGPDATLAAAAQRHGWLQTSDPPAP